MTEPWEDELDIPSYLRDTIKRRDARQATTVKPNAAKENKMETAIQPEADEKFSLMNEAINTIGRLRHENEILSAKVQTMELLGAMLFAKPTENYRGAEVDIAWRMQRYISNAKTKPEPGNSL